VGIRSEAKRIKPSVIERHDGQCYICDFDCRPVLVMHHIVPVGIGGNNDMSNVVSLCPNCHAIVHKMMDFALSTDGCDVGPGALSQGEIGEIWKWSLGGLGDEQYIRLYSLARMETLKQDGDDHESIY
jgi:hypothetical protein